jgi:protein subunit release factor A
LTRKLLFSVTANDCKWSYTKGTGNGGQKKQKTSSAVHCIHEPSGAHAFSQETRSQPKNKEIAFRKMCETHAFQTWHKLECMRITGKLAEIEIAVEKRNEESKSGK